MKQPVVKSCITQIDCCVCGCINNSERFRYSRRTIVQCLACGHEYVSPVPLKSIPSHYHFPPADQEELAMCIDCAYLSTVLSRYGLVNCRTLDLGCGEGRIGLILRRLGWEERNIWMVDNSPDHLGAARLAHPGARAVLADVQSDLGLVEEFDCVLMVELLEHLPKPGAAMEVALRALRPGGLLIVRAIPNNDSLEAFIAGDQWKMRTMETHYHFFNVRTFSKFMARFTCARLLEFGCFLQPGYRFYDVHRLARDLGVFQKTSHGALFEAVRDKLRGTNFEAYVHRNRLPAIQWACPHTSEQLAELFNEAHLDVELSPDFSAVILRN